MPKLLVLIIWLVLAFLVAPLLLARLDFVSSFFVVLALLIAPLFLPVILRLMSWMGWAVRTMMGL